MSEILDLFERAALSAGKEILDVYNNDAATRYKVDRSPVTEADERSEAVIVAALNETYPQIPIIAEEGVAAGRIPPIEGDTFFLVDPLDGTREFINQKLDFTVNIALIKNGVPVAGIVYAPAHQFAYIGDGNGAEKLTIGVDFTVIGRQKIFTRQSTQPPVCVVSSSRSSDKQQEYIQRNECVDILRIGSSLKFGLLAEGKADIYPCFVRTMEWDTAAGDAVLRAAGGITITADGKQPIRYGKIIAPGKFDFANPDFIAQGSDLPPPPPVQSIGPHFAIVDGTLDFAPPSSFDSLSNNNDITQIKSLLPIVRRLTAEALIVFGANRPQYNIYRAIKSYSEALEGEAEFLDYGRIAGEGLILANIEAAATRDVKDRLIPELEDSQKALLSSILDLHGPLILSTEAGRRLLSEAALYSRTAEQEQLFRNASIELAKAVSSEGISTDRVGSFVLSTAENIAEGKYPSRTAVYGINTVKNVTITLMIGAIALATGVIAVPWIATVLIGEAVKQSEFGKQTVRIMREALDDPSHKENVKKIAPFILRHENLLHRIAGDQREYKWMLDWIDWLKANDSGKNN